MAVKDDKIVPIKSGVDPALAAVLDMRDTHGLRLNEKRKPIGCLENVVTILRKSPEWQGVLANNEFMLAIEKKKPPPFAHPVAGEWTDEDDNELRLWVSQQFDVRATEKDIAAAVGIVAARNKYHPVRLYLCGLEWDGTPRLRTWLQEYLGARVPEDDQRSHPEYYAKAGTWWLMSAVARIFEPGCQADHVLLLEGEQGIGKSSALRILFSPWYSDTPLRIGDKDSYGALRGVWGYELAELDSLNRAESSASKAFFTSMEDKYRPPYGHRDIRAKRQCVFAGTINHDQYLRDSTGNRRYWPVRCGDMRLRGIDSLEAVRDQLFAEALTLYRAGDLWHPVTDEEKALFTAQQAEREIGDVYEDLIDNGTRGKVEISMATIFTDILDTEPAKMTRAEQIRVGEAMRRLGWEKKRIRAAGTQARSYVYVRKDFPAAGAVEGDDDVPI
jgi:putative DNA primase/helicase